MHADQHNFYSSRLERFSIELKSLNKRINIISNLRLVAVALIFVTVYYASKNNNIFYFIPVEIIVFVLLIQQHAVMFRKKVHLENLVKIQGKELKGLQGNYEDFEKGTEFIDPHHPYTHDLDIFGEGSLYQALNRCSTLSGKQKLAQRLSSPLPSIEEITRVQEAVKELSAKPEFCQEIQASGMEIEEASHDRQQILDWLKYKPFLFGKTLYHILLLVLPIIMISLIITSIFVEGIFTWIVFVAIIEWGLLAVNFQKVNTFHEFIGKKKNVLVKYAALLKIIEQNSFESKVLKGLQEKAKTAGSKVEKLASLSNALDARANILTNLFVNSTIMFDLQCVYRLEKWKEENAQSLEQWLDVVREIEVLNSFATFSFNNSDFSFAEVNAERTLVASSLGHPLILKNERVDNDVQLNANDSILIITGANMAGKSTFLRTLGINVVLALSGSVVCAKSFNCPLVEIRSGMRTSDSLKDHQSYFFAELNRLKSIVDELKTGRQLLILLDEILKGTNSSDKQAGSVSLVKQLKDYPSLVLIATHDLILGDLENQYPGKVRNFCFEPTIIHDQLSFDYKMKRGIATKMNATFLMKKMGIIPA